MKTGLTLQDLVAQIDARAAAKEDFVADTRQIAMTGDTKLALAEREFPLTEHAHGQIAARLDIPAKYYNRMRAEQPGLLANNVNTWFTEKPERRMVRTLDGSARAFLSDKYHRMDDDSFANVVLQTVMDIPGAEVVSSGITDLKTHIKVKTPLIARDIKPGDTVHFGLAFSNSEVGAGMLSGSLFTYRLLCLNGMVVEDEAFNARHVGGRIGGKDFGEVFQLDTIGLDANATLHKLRDVSRALLSDEFVNKHIERLQGAAGVQIKSPVKAVERLGKTGGFTEAEREAVLAHFIRGGDTSLFGLAQAVTRAAEDAADYARASELEALGGKVINLPRTQYTELALAA